MYISHHSYTISGLAGIGESAAIAVSFLVMTAVIIDIVHTLFLCYRAEMIMTLYPHPVSETFFAASNEGDEEEEEGRSMATLKRDHLKSSSVSNAAEKSERCYIIIILAALALWIRGEGRLFLSAAISIPAAIDGPLVTHAEAAALAVNKGEIQVASSLPTVEEERASTHAAPAAGFIFTRSEHNSFFSSFPFVGSTPLSDVVVNAVILRHTRLLGFFLLLLLWFAVAAWCPVHLFPLLLLPQYVRRRILHDIHEAKATLARLQDEEKKRKQQQCCNHQHTQQTQKECMQSKKGEMKEKKKKDEVEEISREHQALGKSEHQQGQHTHQQQEKYYKNDMRQRRTKRHEAQLTTVKLHLEATEKAEQMHHFQQHSQSEKKEEKSFSTEIEAANDDTQEAHRAQEILRITRNRSMGFLHASIASVLSLYCLVFDEHLRADRMRNSTWLSTLDGLLLTSYFMWDMTTILFHWRHDSAQWLLHCVVSLLAIAHPSTATPGEPCMSYYAVALSLFELSTPFLALRYFCLKASIPSKTAAAAAREEEEAKTKTIPAATQTTPEAGHATAAAAEDRKVDLIAADGSQNLATEGPRGSLRGKETRSILRRAAARAEVAPETFDKAAATEEEAAATAENAAAGRGEATAVGQGAAEGAAACRRDAADRKEEDATSRERATGGMKGRRSKKAIEEDVTESLYDEAEMSLLNSASNASLPTSRVIPPCTPAGFSLTAAEISPQETVVTKERDKETAAKQKPDQVRALFTPAGPGVFAAAGGGGDRREGFTARQQQQFSLVRLYEAFLSVGFAVTFFLVRIVWGNFFLFPEIYAQILSPAGEGLLPARRMFFLFAMPVFAALNCFWMILLLRVLVSPARALKN